MKKMYLLHGFMFPNEFAHGTSIGAPETLKEFIQYSFSGVIGSSETETKDLSLTGIMLDKWGEAVISDFTETQERVMFQKKYDKEDRLIIFEFTENTGDFWIGKYLTNNEWSGTARLIITPINHLFFNPEVVPI